MTIILIAIIAGVIGLDQLTKWLAVVYLQGEPSFPLWREVLHFTYTENTGMAFGMLKDHRWVFMVFSTVAIVALAIYLFRFRPESRWLQVSLAFIIGGGISGEGQFLVDLLQPKVDAEEFSRDAKKRARLCTATCGNDAGIIGAALA